MIVATSLQSASPWNYFQSVGASDAAGNGGQDSGSSGGASGIDGTDGSNDTTGTQNTSQAKGSGTSSQTEGSDSSSQTKGTGSSSDNLSPAQEREVEKLQKRDKEVKAHEMAHLMAAGTYARSGIHYDYEVGPDGKRYAVGGDVSIDVSKIPGNPKATIQKMRTVERAALAPAHPSGQDRRVAAEAEQAEVQAQLQLVQLNMQQQADTAYQKQSGSSGSDSSGNETASSSQHMVDVVG